eukprot:15451209-Alexandrium_andersonii.AAC.1
MSASLVGSEMCIRDSSWAVALKPLHSLPRPRREEAALSGFLRPRWGGHCPARIPPKGCFRRRAPEALFGGSGVGGSPELTLASH